MSYVITDPGQQNLGARGMSPGPSNGKMLEKVQPARKEESREGGFWEAPRTKAFRKKGVISCVTYHLRWSLWASDHSSNCFQGHAEKWNCRVKERPICPPNKPNNTLTAGIRARVRRSCPTEDT